MGSQVLALKIPLNQAMCRLTDHKRIGRSQSFDARSNVGHFSQCQLFLTPCSTHFTDDDQSSMDAQTESELDTFLALQTAIEVSHGSEDTQASPYCSLGVIFMGLGIPKVHQESIPKELGNVSVKMLDDFSTSRLIGTDDFPVLFGVEAPCQGS